VNHRDTFAAAALTGILAAADDSEIKLDEALFVSKQAWLVADAMLAARGGNPPSPASSVTLTDAEREAVLSAVAHFGQIHWKCRSSHAHADTLRGLLARAAKEDSR
jgi:hypothetical protein